MSFRPRREPLPLDHLMSTVTRTRTLNAKSIDMGAEGDSWLSYNSVQFIKVRNTKLALTYYITQLLILGYVVGFMVIYSKGYQAQDVAVTNTMLKVKGSGSSPDPVTGLPEVFDEYDLVIPPFIPDASFTAVSFIRTENQTKTQCPGNDMDFELCNCTQYHGDVSLCCKEGTYTENGMKTGECDPSGSGFCMLQTWCPLENKADARVVEGVDKWTLFARVNAKFPDPAFNYQTSNTAGSDTTTMGTNLFELGWIVNQSGYTWDSIVDTKGAVFVANFEYNCNLDEAGKDDYDCLPTKSFYRLDDPNNALSKGFNFRTQTTTRDYRTGFESRDLWKLTGVYVLFQVYGIAGKFDIATLAVTLGAGVSYLALATVVCDVVMQYFLPNKDKYLARKFDLIMDEAEPNEAKENLINDHTHAV